MSPGEEKRKQHGLAKENTFMKSGLFWNSVVLSAAEFAICFLSNVEI